MSQPQPQPQPQPGESADGEEIRSIGYENAAEPELDKSRDDRLKGVNRSVAKKEAKRSPDLGARVAGDAATAAAAARSSSSSSSSQYDICRICHMGNNGTASRQSCSSGGGRASQAQLDLGLLVSACRCRGSVGLVHTKCLERWLTESGHTRCELCGYRYATIRVPRHGLLRSLLIWLRTFVATRQMFLDSLYLLVTTPLAVFSAYVCAMTLKMALDNRVAEIPWSIVAMLPTCSLTLVAYWGWLLTLQRLHGRRWRQYWQSNFIIQLLPDTPVDEEQPAPRDDEQQPGPDPFYQDDLYDDLPELFNLI